MNVDLKIKPVLDPKFIPAVLWNKKFRKKVTAEGGNLILSTAEKVLKVEFPELAGKIKFRTPDEKNKRHGQAVAAAGLPEIYPIKDRWIFK